VFPGSGDTPDMNALLQQAQQMQQQLMEAQQRLAETEVEGSAGGGLVTAKVTGTGDLISLDIKPEACDPSDTETLADLVVAAVQNATESAQEMAAQQLGPLTGGFGGDLPGGGGGPQLGF
jgi:DNA-binding YbaB/EbfC family protein